MKSESEKFLDFKNNGYKLVTLSTNDMVIRPTFENTELLEKFVNKTLPVNLSWSELMSIVEKIESIKNNNFVIGSKTVIINTHDKYTNELVSFLESTDLTKIEAVYKTIITFIEWYNTQNK